MKTTLLIGAHLSGVERIEQALTTAQGVALLRGSELRQGAMLGVFNDPNAQDLHKRRMISRARGRIQMRRSQLSAAGTAHLVLSDRSFLGSLRECVSLARFYPTARARLTRLAAVIGEVDHIGLMIHPYETFWNSALNSVWGAPHGDQLTRIRMAYGGRGWGDIISEVRAAFPQSRLTVWRSDDYGTRTGASVSHLLEGEGGVDLSLDETDPAPQEASRFSDEQINGMRRAYADDLAWLKGSANATAMRARPAAALCNFVPALTMPANSTHGPTPAKPNTNPLHSS